MSRNLREGWIRLTGVALHACIFGIVALIGRTETKEARSSAA